jgi:hypothetical protein
VAGVAIGVALGDLILNRRQRRLAAEAMDHFGEGEQLAAPIGFCSRGGRRMLIGGAALMVLSLVAAICISRFSTGGLADAVGWGGMGAGLLVIFAALPFAKNYVVVLTDRRVLLFRTGNFRQHAREIWIGVPRAEVSMSVRNRIDGAALRFGFAHATGIAPVQLDVYRNGAGVQYVQAIQHALTTPVAAQGV